VDPEARDRPIPLPQEHIVGIEAVEAAPFQRVGFDVAAAALLFSVFFRIRRPGRQRREAPVRRERQVDVMAVGVEEARAYDRRFEIVMTHDERHTTQIAECALVESEEGLELLIPHRFFVPMARVTEREAKDPRPPPFTGRDIERRGATEEIDLPFGAGCAMKHPDRSTGRREGPHEAFHRFVARAVAVLLDQVLARSVAGSGRRPASR
jgi:hypothetical protein